MLEVCHLAPLLMSHFNQMISTDGTIFFSFLSRSSFVWRLPRNGSKLPRHKSLPFRGVLPPPPPPPNPPRLPEYCCLIAVIGLQLLTIQACTFILFTWVMWVCASPSPSVLSWFGAFCLVSPGSSVISVLFCGTTSLTKRNNSQNVYADEEVCCCSCMRSFFGTY